MINPWKILGVHRQMSDEDIHKKYLQLARTLHPDVNRKPEARGQFAEISEAYHILGDRRRLSSFLRSMIALSRECTKCRGQGALSEHVGYRVKIFKRCDTCGGAGVHMPRG